MVILFRGVHERKMRAIWHERSEDYCSWHHISSDLLKESPSLHGLYKSNCIMLHVSSVLPPSPSCSLSPLLHIYFFLPVLRTHHHSPFITTEHKHQTPLILLSGRKMSLKTTILALAALFLTLNFCQTNAAPTHPQEKRSSLSSSAPFASDIDGVSILIDNDVDSSTPKFSFLLLSHPRSYDDGMTACHSLSEGEAAVWTTRFFIVMNFLLVVKLDT